MDYHYDEKTATTLLIAETRYGYGIHTMKLSESMNTYMAPHKAYPSMINPRYKNIKGPMASLTYGHWEPFATGLWGSRA